MQSITGTANTIHPMYWYSLGVRLNNFSANLSLCQLGGAKVYRCQLVPGTVRRLALAELKDIDQIISELKDQIVK